MSDTNLNYLRSNLNRVGFPDEVLQKMEEQLKTGAKEFKVDHEIGKANGELVQYELKFKQSDSTENYFFNSYTATLKTGVEDRDKTQNFNIRNGNNITMDEAFNLAAGRAVQKSMVNADGDTYQAWLKVDFSQKDKYENYKVDQFHERYGYNLEKALHKFPVAELSKPEEKAELVASLRAGNLVAVTITKDGKDALLFIEANPRLRTINIKDEKGMSVRRDQLEKKEQRQAITDPQSQNQQNSQRARRSNTLSV